MIIVLILLSVVLAFYFAVFIQNKKVGYSLMAVSIVVFLCGLVMLISNEYNHFGMHKVTSEKTEQIQTVQKGNNILLYKELGTSGKEDVYIYRRPETAKAKNPDHTKAKLNVTNKVKKGASSNTLAQKTTRWEYKNGFYSFLFGISGNDKEFVKQTNTFHIGDDWLVLSTTQAAKLSKEMKSKKVQAQMKTQGEAYVKAALTTAMTQNPTMSASQQKQVMKQAQKEFKAQAMAKVVKELTK
ncbi:DUF4811 domain-containing protein [Companilactobacillus allii]|uniref:DUF4811 domain-containing protein n=1 Tax=Companilactobacillus allii TaxID=1847728 RepID=A0A1P8Q090_9LACO|nr:DUF4811 domain-containing protein [Companilactobacillus allii]APX71246.1 DUF4811 domain-containing protein [Companilactobacillus allii]USQ68327.1 DUF4811 domain-containing protein [Companilactobacillus allii]